MAAKPASGPESTESRSGRCLPRGVSGGSAGRLGGSGLPSGVSNRALFDSLLGRRDHDSVYEDSGCMDVFRVKIADFDQLLDLDHGVSTAGGHHRVEVPGGLSEDEVA